MIHLRLSAVELFGNEKTVTVVLRFLAWLFFPISLPIVQSNSLFSVTGQETGDTRRDGFDFLVWQDIFPSSQLSAQTLFQC